jgi:hypothetical protein
MRSASLFTTASSAAMLAMATSDQWVSLRRSACGNRTACQHHGGELGRHPIDPVEDFSTRQPVEHGRGALADQSFHIGEVGGRLDRRHDLALRGMAGRVHAEEVGQLLALGRVGDLDAAQLRG